LDLEILAAARGSVGPKKWSGQLAAVNEQFIA
jgi:hypothetical protein